MMNMLDLAGKETRLNLGEATDHIVRDYKGMSYMEARSLLRENHQHVDFIDTNDTNQRLQAGVTGPIRIIRIINIIHIIIT
jgi:predicted 2-oxoglutarate/Fe(II)-dependent dioxygenase YbiX